jgi:hypothetical protein
LNVTESTLAIPLRDFSGALELEDQTHDHFLKVWLVLNGDSHEAAIATVPATGSLDLSGIPALCLAEVLTRLRRASRGPVRVLLKEARRKYRRVHRQDRRPPRSLAVRNVEEEFKKKALCVIEVCQQIEIESRREDLPSVVMQWKSTGGLASREFPEIYQQVWSRYNKVLEKQHAFDNGRMP